MPFGPSGHGPRLKQLDDVLVAPLRLTDVSTDPRTPTEVPVTLPGLVHLENRVTTHRRLDAGEPLTLVDALIELHESVGAARTTVTEVARRAGIPLE